MKNETQISASTKINGVSHKSNVTIDWTGMTDEDVQALAQRSLIIRKQNADRVNGIVPETSYVLKAADFKIGSRVAKVAQTPEQMLAALSDEERAKLIAKFLTT